MTRSPGEHRLREHVVEDLVPRRCRLRRASAGCDGRRASPSTGRSSTTGTRPKFGEVRDLVGDLRPRRRHEVVEDPRGDVLLRRRQLGHRAFEVLLDDVLRATEALERLHATLGARRPLLVPEPLHDELEVRRLDPAPVCDRPRRRRGRRAPARSGPRPPRRALARPAPAARRRARRSSSRSARPGARSPHVPRAVEPVEPQRVREEPGMRPVKRSSFASESSRSDTRTFTRSGVASDRGQRLGERAGTAVVRVVEEVLLGLVEDEIDVPFGLRAARAPRAADPFGRPAASPTRLGKRDSGSSLQREKTTTSGSSGSSAASARRRRAAATTSRRRSARRARSAERR